CASDVFFLSDFRPRVLVNGIENFANFWVIRCATDNCEDTFTEFPCQPRHACRRFSLEGLAIQTSFSCDHNIGIFDFGFEPGRFCDNIKSRPNFRAAKTHQPKSKSACRAGAMFVAIIKSKLIGNHVGEPGQRALQNLNRVLSRAVLRTKHACRAVLSEQRILHIDRRDDFWQLELVWPSNPHQRYELAYRFLQEMIRASQT